MKLCVGFASDLRTPTSCSRNRVLNSFLGGQMKPPIKWYNGTLSACFKTLHNFNKTLVFCVYMFFMKKDQPVQKKTSQVFQRNSWKKTDSNKVGATVCSKRGFDFWGNTAHFLAKDLSVPQTDSRVNFSPVCNFYPLKPKWTSGSFNILEVQTLADLVRNFILSFTTRINIVFKLKCKLMFCFNRPIQSVERCIFGAVFFTFLWAKLYLWRITNGAFLVAPCCRKEWLMAFFLRCVVSICLSSFELSAENCMFNFWEIWHIFWPKIFLFFSADYFEILARFFEQAIFFFIKNVDRKKTCQHRWIIRPIVCTPFGTKVLQLFLMPCFAAHGLNKKCPIAKLDKLDKLECLMVLCRALLHRRTLRDGSTDKHRSHSLRYQGTTKNPWVSAFK